MTLPGNTATSRLRRAAPASAAALALGCAVGYVLWLVSDPGDHSDPSGRAGAGAYREGAADGAGEFATTITVVGDAGDGEGPPGARAGNLRGRRPGPWRVGQAAFRQIVEIDLPPAGRATGRPFAKAGPEPLATARVELSPGSAALAEIAAAAADTLEGVRLYARDGLEVDLPDAALYVLMSGVRVFDSAGRELRARLSPVDAGIAFEVVFEVPRGGKPDGDASDDGGKDGLGGPFEVYYPAPDGRRLPAARPGAPAPGKSTPPRGARGGARAGRGAGGEGDRGRRGAEGGDGEEGGVSLTVYPLTGKSTSSVGSPGAVSNFIDGAAELGPARRRRQINDCKIPYNRQDNYVAVYRAHLACREAGTHTFGLDADDRAHLMIDGEVVLSGGAPGRLPERPFQYRTTRRLERGLHALTLFHVQGSGALRARLAWRTPGQPGGGGGGGRRGREGDELLVIPPSAFVSHLPARAVALEKRDGRSVETFFSATPRRRVLVNRSVPVTEWELVASGPGDAAGPNGDAGAPQWVWREEGPSSGWRRTLGTGDSLRVFVSGLAHPASGIEPRREITLALVRYDRAAPSEPPTPPFRSAEGGAGSRRSRRTVVTLGRFTRVLGAKPVDASEGDELLCRVEAGSAPLFLYPQEPFDVHLRAVNDSDRSATLEVVERRVERACAPKRYGARRRAGTGLRPGGRAVEVRAFGGVELPGVAPPGRDVVARRTNRVRRSFGPHECERIERLVYTIGPPGAPAAALDIVFLSSRAGILPRLEPSGGTLAVAARDVPGDPPARTRALPVFVMPYDSEAELRRWSFVGDVSLAASGTDVALLYGDPLASPGAAGGEGLVPRMRRSLGGEGNEGLHAIPFPDGSHPIYAAITGASRAFARSQWGTIWVSLGTLDVRAGTPRRDYERGIDMLIDRAWAVAPQARLVIVGPPPEWGRSDVSERYAAWAREVARRHRVPFVDLHEFVDSLGETDDLYREPGSDDGVRFPYPLGEAMDAVARAVLDG